MKTFKTLSLQFTLTLSIALCSSIVLAQTARKPSFYENKNQVQRLFPSPHPTSAPDVQTEQDWFNTLKDREEFDLISRIYNKNTPFEIPHIIFTIDIKSNKTYFINTPKFELHEHFITHLTGQALSRTELNKNYYQTDRDYIFGTLSWQMNQQLFTFEFWEGDKITPHLLKLTQEKLNNNFFENVRFKTNSTWHEEVAQNASIPYITQAELIQGQSFMPLNIGEAKGRLVVIEREEDLDFVNEHDIVLLTEVPLTLPPVAGVITEKPSTILSHVNLLTKGWGIPNIYLHDARKILAPLINQPISLNVSFNNYTIEPLSSDELIGSEATPSTAITNLPKPNISDNKIRPLSGLMATDSIYCGAKAANLGEVNARIRSVNIPDGFCIPFAYYDQFMQSYQLKEKLEQLQALPDFHTNTRVRRAALKEFRNSIMQHPLDSNLLQRSVTQWNEQLKGQGVFVRSSSNSEDLPNFSGAGLYTTIPNVITPDALEKAIKSAWASVYNFEAYEARRVARIPHDHVVMSVFVQVAANADASGVLVTKDPFNPAQNNSSYIVAKRGLGIRVVEGRKVAEQVIYSHHSKAIQVLTRSEDTTALLLDDKGGVVELTIEPKREVLTDALIIKLAQTGLQIKQLYRGVDQDIEWAVEGDKIIILQVRPFIQN